MGPLLDLVDLVLRLYMWLLIASAIMSWLVTFQVINTSNRAISTVGNFLYQITEPALKPIRRVVRRVLPNLRGVDISPLILIIGIWFLRRIIAGL
jgi:YggT family protein